jgi:hypothetical protein
MTSGYPDEREEADPAFPDTVDDADPERELLDDPQRAALPGDDYLGADEFGTTGAEQFEGESLADRLAREMPEPAFDPDAADYGNDTDAELDRETRLLSDPEGPYVGRLVEPDEGAHTDIERDAVAREVRGGYDVSPEEAAMHVEPEV